MKYYIDDQNHYLGGWDDNPPAGAREVPLPPDDARQPWLGDHWGPVPISLQGHIAAAQNLLDSSAQAYGYDSIASAVTYAEEPAVPKFQAEGQAFRAWRSLVWAYGYEQLALVEAGERPAPTIPEFIAELPPLDLPAPSTAGQE